MPSSAVAFLSPVFDSFNLSATILDIELLSMSRLVVSKEFVSCKMSNSDEVNPKTYTNQSCNMLL